MRCPFLQEAQVKFCSAFAYKKLILQSASSDGRERCSSAAWRSCSVAQQHHQGPHLPERCPFLHESLMQYCSASAVTKYIPYGITSESRCSHEGFKACDVYRNILQGRDSSSKENESTSELPQDLIVPVNKGFTRNHLWFSLANEGHWRVGPDAFLARLTGTVEAVHFPETRGFLRPEAVFRLRSGDLSITFPRAMNLLRTNRALTVQPRPVTDDPYESGWLFEGREEEWGMEEQELLFGEDAQRWMAQEYSRLTERVHALPRAAVGDLPTLNDGGAPAAGLLQMLDRKQMLQLYREFFSPDLQSKGKS